MSDFRDSMPPGWECKSDDQTGRQYYINHFNKTTTWEDPRIRLNRALPHGTSKHFSNMQVEHIPLQHGSPELRRNYIYPSQTSPMPAFQMPASPKIIPLQEMRNVSRMSPLTLKNSKIQETSLTILTDSDDPVAKISAMFPTVSETHIRLLLKNCRYMKSLFPQADETIILDVLQNHDNNIQKTSDALKELGFPKKESSKSQIKVESKKEVVVKKEDVESKPITPKNKTSTPEEKVKMKEKLQEQYKDVANHLITIALESVDFDENRANQILQIMVQEDNQSNGSNKENTNTEENTEQVDSHLTVPVDLPISQSRQSIKSMLKSEKGDRDKSPFSRVVEEYNFNDYKSPNLSNTRGPNAKLQRGANDSLLLEEYVKWQGPNANFYKGSQTLAKGPNSSLLSNRSYKACGPNSELRKGPKFGLAKGSIFSQLKVVLVGESRGE